MKFRMVLFPLICIILLTLSACYIENAGVYKNINDNIDIQTKYGDELHFDISSCANLHHQFIKYRISLSNVTEMENNVVDVVLRDQSETVYDDPLSVLSEIVS